MSENWYCTGCGSTSYPWHHLGCTGPRPVVAVAPSGEPSDERPWCCPVCNGAGHINRPPWIAGDQPTYTTAEIRTYPCNACGGTGIVWRSRAASVPASPAGDDQ